MSKDCRDIIKRAIEAPFGKAEKILKQEGFWDEHIDAGPITEYSVQVYGEIRVTKIIKVSARSEDAAIEKAMEMAANPGFDWGSDYADVDVTDARVQR